MPEEQTAVERAESGRSYEETLALHEQAVQRVGATHALMAELNGGELFDPSDAVVRLAGNDTAAAFRLHGEEWKTARPDLAGQIDPLVEQIVKEYTELKTVEAEGLPIVEATFAQKSKALVDDVRWDDVMEFEASNHSNSDIGLAIKMMGSPDQYGKGGFEDIVYSIGTIGRVHDELREQGFTRDEPYEASTEVYVGHGNLAGTIKDWVRNTNEAMRYISKSRYEALDDVMPRDGLTRLARLADRSGLNGQSDTLTPGVIVDAMERAAAKRMTAFDNQDVNIIKQNYAERANLMLVKGGERLTRTADIQDPQAYFDQLFHEWPHWFSQGTSVIEIVDQIADDTPDTDTTEGANADATTKRVTNGTWRQHGRTLQLNAHTQYYDDMVAFGAKNGHDEAFVRAIICTDRKAQIGHTTVHELTHKSHFNMFPMRWLREWYAAVGKDDKAPTGYVRSTKDAVKNASEEDNLFDLENVALLEDLSDSLAEYRYHPAHLVRTSIERFALIQKLIEGYEMSTALALIQMTVEIKEDNPDKDTELASLDRIGASYFRKAPKESPMFATL